MNRRRLLFGCSTALAGLAGCLGGLDTTEETPVQTPTDTPTAAPTESPTATPTESPTATPTESPTATPTRTPRRTVTPAQNSFSHDVEEQFTVGSDRTAVTYRVLRYRKAERIGDSMSWVDADGVFLLVYLQVTNPQDRRIAIPRDDFRIKSPETWYKFSEEATQKIESEDRIDVRSLAVQGVEPGQSITGALAFDVDPDSSVRVWVTPMKGPDTPQHFVPVGRLSIVQEL